MKLDSVLSLKAQLLAEVATVPKAASAMSFAVRAMTATRLPELLRSVALGVAPGSGGFKLAVRVQRRELETGRLIEKIVGRAKGEADVRYVGRIEARANWYAQAKASAVTASAKGWQRKRCRPLRIGCSIGHELITAGTLGCFVKDKAGEVFALSNNHVLANENHAKPGDDILQPGPTDKGKPTDRVGGVGRFIALKTGKTNLVDAALAELDDGIEYELRKLGTFGNLKGVLPPDELDKGVRVHKVGRTTFETTGRVTAFGLDNVVVAYSDGNCRFDDQIEIEGADVGPFSQGGDSGSLIFDDKLRAVALLFAGGDVGGKNGKGLTYGNPIQTVLDELDVELAL